MREGHEQDGLAGFSVLEADSTGVPGFSPTTIRRAPTACNCVSPRLKSDANRSDGNAMN
jgi:hypothetical protein